MMGDCPLRSGPCDSWISLARVLPIMARTLDLSCLPSGSSRRSSSPRLAGCGGQARGTPITRSTAPANRRAVRASLTSLGGGGCVGLARRVSTLTTYAMFDGVSIQTTSSRLPGERTWCGPPGEGMGGSIRRPARWGIHGRLRTGSSTTRVTDGLVAVSAMRIGSDAVTSRRSRT